MIIICSNNCSYHLLRDDWVPSSGLQAVTFLSGCPHRASKGYARLCTAMGRKASDSTVACNYFMYNYPVASISYINVITIVGPGERMLGDILGADKRGPSPHVITAIFRAFSLTQKEIDSCRSHGTL